MSGPVPLWQTTSECYLLQCCYATGSADRRGAALRGAAPPDREDGVASRGRLRITGWADCWRTGRSVGTAREVSKAVDRRKCEIVASSSALRQSSMCTIMSVTSTPAGTYSKSRSRSACGTHRGTGPARARANRTRCSMVVLWRQRSRRVSPQRRTAETARRRYCVRHGREAGGEGGRVCARVHRGGGTPTHLEALPLGGEAAVARSRADKLELPLGEHAAARGQSSTE